MMRFGTILAVLALAACGPAGNDPGPGGVTVDEAKALDDAAEMLEERRLPEEVLPGRPPDEDEVASGEAASAEPPAAAPPAQ